MKMCIYMYMKYVNVYILLELGKKAGQLFTRWPPPPCLPLQIILYHIIPYNKD